MIKAKTQKQLSFNQVATNIMRQQLDQHNSQYKPMYGSLNQDKRHKNSINSRPYTLTITSMKIIASATQNIKSQYFSFKIYDNGNEAIIKQSPVFNKDANQTWVFTIYSNQIKLMLYAEHQYNYQDKIRSTGNPARRRQQLGELQLNQSRNIQYLFSKRNKNQMIATVHFEIKLKKSNHFQHNSLLFSDNQDQPLKNQNKNTNFVKKRQFPSKSNFKQAIKRKNANKKQKIKIVYEDQQQITEVSQQNIVTEDQNKTFHKMAQTDEQSQRKMLKIIDETSRMLQDSMKKSQQQQKMFSKYLDQSTSYINQLEKQQEYNRKILEQKIFDISQIKQQKSQQQLTTQEKWYNNNFNKPHTTNKIKPKNSMFDKQVKNERKDKNKVILKYQALPKNSFQLNKINNQSKQISDITFGISDKNVKQIKFYVKTNKDKKQQQFHLYLQMVNEDGAVSSTWPATICLHHGFFIQVLCILQKNGQKLIGCIGDQQQKQQKCQLFNEQGDLQAIMYFKIKYVSEIVVQTCQFLPQNNKTEQLKNDEQNRNQKIQITFSKPKQPKVKKVQSKIGQEDNKKQQYAKFKKLNQNAKENQLYLQHVSSILIQQTNLPNFNQKKPNLYLNSDYIRGPQNQQKKQEIQLNSPLLGPNFVKSQRINQNNDQINTGSMIQQQQIFQINQDQKQLSVKKINFRNTSFINKKVKNFRKYTDTNLGEKRKQILNQQQQDLSHKNKKLFNQGNNPAQTQNVAYFPNSPRQHFNLTELSVKNMNQKQPISSYRLYESQAVAKNNFNQQRFNFKITNIDIRLRKPSHTGKFLQISLNSQSVPYFTETSKQLFFLNWKGKGYIFINISKFSVLTVSMIEQTGNINMSIASCKIHLNLLKKNENEINQYQDYIRDQNQQVIGTFLMDYQLFQKSHHNVHTQNFDLTSSAADQLTLASGVMSKIRSKKTPIFLQNDRQSIYSRPRGLSNIESQLAKSKVSKNKSTPRNKKTTQRNCADRIFIQKQLKNKISPRITTLRVRKYRGGNIIIPRAKRFNTEGTQKQQLGPGAYNYQSIFERHAQPL